MANDPTGTYERDNGKSRVKVTRCGDAFCGTIVWLKNPDGPAKVGQRVLYDMRPAGPNRWTGKAVNPEDGKTYDGRITRVGKTMKSQGCVLGGLFCQSVNWTKIK